MYFREYEYGALVRYKPAPVFVSTDVGEVVGLNVKVPSIWHVWWPKLNVTTAIDCSFLVKLSP